jgi:hypothetical protein
MNQQSLSPLEAQLEHLHACALHAKQLAERAVKPIQDLLGGLDGVIVLQSLGVAQPDQPLEVEAFHELLLEHLPRLLASWNPVRGSFADYLRGAVKRDRRAGVIARELKAVAEAQRLQPVFDDAPEVVSVGARLEWANDPADRLEDGSDASLEVMFGRDVQAVIDQVSPAWAEQDGSQDRTPKAKQAREVAYRVGLEDVLERLKAREPVRTPNGRVNFSVRARERIRERTGYSVPVVRAWLDALGQRLPGLVDDVTRKPRA